MKRAPRPRVIEAIARADRPERWSAKVASQAAARGAALAGALERGELALHYQPIVDLRSGQCRRLEALLRWRTSGGSVAPSEIVAAAEASGQMAALSRWVIGEAARQWVIWREQGLRLGIAVNVAGPELADEAVIDEVTGLLRDLRVDPKTITFDISATALLSVADIHGALRRLALAGTRFALDGVSLADVPGRSFALGIDELKLSRSLVRRLGSDPAAMHEVRALVELARDLGLSVVAVGVEDLATRDIVASLDCEFAQGHWVSRPLAARRIAPWQRVAVGLAFGGAMAFTSFSGAAKASGTSGSSLARSPDTARGILPCICALDLPTLSGSAAAVPQLETLTERTGRAFVQHPASHADLFIEAAVPRADRARIAGAVERDVTALEAEYGRSFATRPTVYVFATRASFALGLQQAFGVRATEAGVLAAANGGVTLARQGAIVINLQNVLHDAELAIVRHELTHALLHEIVGRGAELPAWFDEGLATLEERGLRPDKSGIRDAAVTLRLLADDRVSLSDLGPLAQWAQRNAALNGDGYTVAAEAVRVLRERVTDAGLIQILEATGGGTPFAQAYAEVAGESLADFERAFPARLSVEQGAPRLVQARQGNDIRWTIVGFAPGSTVNVSIEGTGYKLAYEVTTDRYGMFSGMFGSTAPAGDYSVRASGPGGTANGNLQVARQVG
ncbi:MAG: EAL domain-containing protein [Chloroflexota bacterium]